MIAWVPHWKPWPIQLCAVEGCKNKRRLENRQIGDKVYETMRRYCGTHCLALKRVVNRQGGAIVETSGLTSELWTPSAT